MPRTRTALFTLSAVTMLAGHAAAAAADPVYDLIIRHGTVFDGTGSAGRVADVGIIGNRIVAVGDLSRAKGRADREARGRYVTPGFVSVHDHSQAEAYAKPSGLLTQGVTTAIANPDGGGPLNLSAQLNVPMGVNYGAYIGFNAVWREVVGLENKRPTPQQVARMQELVKAGMEAGAFGVSAGLDYKPGFWATTDEVAAVSKAAAPWRTQFTNHERVYPGNDYSSMAGMTETVQIGEKAGLMPVITHAKLQGRDHGKVGATFRLATDAAPRGVTVGYDAYPYTFGATSLEQLTIPSWAQEGGNEAMLARFKDPALRQRIIAETADQLEKRWGGAGGVYLAEMQKELTAVIAEMGNVAPAEAIIRLLEQGQRRVLLRFGTEADQAAIVVHPLTAVSCDCGASLSKTGHPRNWGSYPRVLGRYVREQKLMPWSEAVRKMTALPATMLGLAERGYLMPGMIADVTIFDPATVIDRATIDQPVQPSVGIETVVINGKLALDGGKVTETVAGKPLARSPHEPSRRMNLDVARKLMVSGTVAGSSARVTVQLEQRAGAARPTGRVQITGLDRAAFSFTPSILQTTDGWASVTGIGRWSDGRQQAVTLLAEQADPFASAQPSLTLLVDGKAVLAGTLPRGAIKVTQAKK